MTGQLGIVAVLDINNTTKLHGLEAGSSPPQNRQLGTVPASTLQHAVRTALLAQSNFWPWSTVRTPTLHPAATSATYLLPLVPCLQKRGVSPDRISIRYSAGYDTDLTQTHGPEQEGTQQQVPPQAMLHLYRQQQQQHKQQQDIPLGQIVQQSRDK
jgi:hypothetical protein